MNRVNENFSCDYCNKNFITSKLLKHLKQKHDTYFNKTEQELSTQNNITDQKKFFY